MVIPNWFDNKPKNRKPSIFKRFKNLFKRKLNNDYESWCIEEVAKELLFARTIIANADKKATDLEKIIEKHYKAGNEETMIIGNAKVYSEKQVIFDFGEDEQKADKNRKAFAKGLLVNFYHRIPHYRKIAEEIEKGEAMNSKIKKLMEKYKPTIKKDFKVRIKHVNPTVKN